MGVCLMLFTYWEISTYPVSIGKLTLDPLEMSALFELINELGVTQVVDRPTHKQNNILDLILTTANEVPFIIVDKLFSDHYPIIFHCSINEHPAHVQSCYSRSSFDPLVFNSCLHDLFNYISRDNSSDPSFLDSWFYL